MPEPEKKRSVLALDEVHEEHGEEADNGSVEANEPEAVEAEMLLRTARAKEFDLIDKLAESGEITTTLKAEIFELLETPHKGEELKAIIREHEAEAADIRTRLPWNKDTGNDNKYKDHLRLLQPLSTYIDEPGDLQKDSRSKGKKGESKMINNQKKRPVTDGSGKVIALDKALQEHINVIPPDKNKRLVYRWVKYEPTVAVPYLSEDESNRIQVGDLVTARQVASTSSHNFLIHNSERIRKSTEKGNEGRNCSFLKMAIITSSGVPVGNAMVLQKDGTEKMQLHGSLHYEDVKKRLEDRLEMHKKNYELNGNDHSKTWMDKTEAAIKENELIRQPQAEVLVKRWVVFEVIDIKPVDVKLDNDEVITDVHVILQEKELTDDEEVKEIKDVFTGKTIMETSNGKEDINELRRKSLTEVWDGTVEETIETVAPVVTGAEPVVTRPVPTAKKKGGFGFFRRKI